MGQAKDLAALLAAAATAGHGRVLSVHTAVPRVSETAGTGGQLQRLRLTRCAVWDTGRLARALKQETGKRLGRYAAHA